MSTPRDPFSDFEVSPSPGKGRGERRGLEALDFDKVAGLIPTVVQHADTGAVLMLGYMSREALDATLTRRRVVFFSRSKGRLWEKGENSGNRLELVDARADCDGDALLVMARPEGPTCHLGEVSCFGKGLLTRAQELEFLIELERIIADRIAKSPESSYTAKLVASGLNRVAQKVAEEALEVALAAGGTREELVAETADLLFHLLVLLGRRQVEIQDIVRTLELRHRDRAKDATAGVVHSNNCF